MDDDIDAFLASLDTLASPSISAGISQLGAAASTSPPPPPSFQSVNQNRMQQRGRKRDRPPPPLSDQHGGVESHGTSSNHTASTAPPASPRQTAAAAESSISGWTCAVCTLINEGGSASCLACDSPSPLGQGAVSRPMTVNNATRNLLKRCIRCTFDNPPGRKRCGMCGSALSLTCSGSSHHVLEADYSPQQQQQQNRSATDPRPVAVSDDNNDDDEEDGNDTSDDADSDSDGSGGSTTDGRDDQQNNLDLVQFLQTLDFVPYEQLPLAPAPETMRQKAELRDFQRQALHWLLSREGKTSAPEQQQQQQHANHVPPPESCSSASALSPTLLLSRAPSSTSLFSPDSEGAEEDMRLHAVRGGIFADYMGLGKTRTMLSLCEATRGPRYDRVTGSQVASSATLVVCPPSLLQQWKQEIQDCVEALPDIEAPRVLVYHSRKRNISLFELAQSYDYVLTTYHTLRRDALLMSGGAASASGGGGGGGVSRPGKMAMIYWHRIILDEAHIIRNMRAKVSAACVGLSGQCRWAVTATPIHNSLNDLFPLLKFLKVPHFSSTEWWNREIVGYFNTDPHHPRPVTALKVLFGSLLLRRTPDSVVNGRPILDLPPKTTETLLVQLSREERVFYDATHDSAARKIEAQQHQQPHARRALATFSTAFEMWIRCRQSCLHPYIVVAALKRIQLLKKNGTSAAVAVAASADAGEPFSPSAGEAAAAAARKKAQETEAEEAAAAFLRARSAAIDKYVNTILRHRLVAARQSSFVAELVDELKKQELERRDCGICLDSLHIPAILPCAHTFCEACINHALQFQKKCPMCKSGTRPKDVLVVPTEFLTNAADNHQSPSSQPPAGGSARASIQDLSSQLSVDVVTNIAEWSPALSSKTLRLLDIIHRIPSEERIIVFSSFVTYLTFAQHCLERAGVRCGLYTGALTIHQKNALLHRFRDTSDPNAPRVLLATAAACGVGLNLTCANHCVLMEPMWNPAAEEQALNRVHRIGQTRPVSIWRLVAQGTVEEKIEALCQGKRGLSTYCFHAVGATSSGMKPEDLVALFAGDSDADTSDTSDDSD